MKEKSLEYDVLRAWAALMIIVTHIILGFGLSKGWGYYISSTFVYVFLLLSAYLLGIHGKKLLFQEKELLI